MSAGQPRLLEDESWRQTARRMRDHQWEFMEKVDRLGTVWFCVWDKARRHTVPAEDVLACGLIDGMEMLEWFGQHDDWWIIGEWSDERYARPVQLTDAGREALKNRHLYDAEPVRGGLVEPGWMAYPAERDGAVQ